MGASYLCNQMGKKCVSKNNELSQNKEILAEIMPKTLYSCQNKIVFDLPWPYIKWTTAVVVCLKCFKKCLNDLIDANFAKI